MFGLGMGEMIIIAVVALLVLGPEKLPDAAKSLSKGIRDFRKHSRDLQRTIEDDEQIGGAIRDIKSALRGEDLYVPPHLNRDAIEDDTDDDAHIPEHDWLANGNPSAIESSSGDSEAAGDTGSASSDSASSDSASSDSADDDAPVIRPAAGAIAKNSSEPLAPTPATPATAAAATATPAPDDVADDAHG